MSDLSVNNILDASGGATTTINGFTPTVSNMVGRNRIINGDMRIDQRNAGAAVTAGSGYTLDRWNVDRTWAGATTTIQQVSTAPPEFAGSLLATVSTGATVAAASYLSIQQYVEGFNIVGMAWGTASAKSFTVSFWTRSSVTGVFGVGFRNSAFDRHYWTTYTIDVANTWEYKTVTIAGDTTGTWGAGNSYGINLIFSLGCGTNSKAPSNNVWGAGNKIGAVGEVDLIATTGATFYITGVQLEAGSVATPFEHRQYGQELALCQRYCLVDTNTSQPYRAFGNGNTSGTTAGYITRQLPVPMRTAPSVTPSSGTVFLVDVGATAPATTSVTDNGFSTPTIARVAFTVGSGLSAGQVVILVSDGSYTLRSITYSAEL